MKNVYIMNIRKILNIINIMCIINILNITNIKKIYNHYENMRIMKRLGLIENGMKWLEMAGICHGLCSVGL